MFFNCLLSVFELKKSPFRSDRHFIGYNLGACLSIHWCCFEGEEGETKRGVKERMAVTNQTWFQTANVNVTALDPRFKDLKSLPRETREQVRTMIISRTNESNLALQYSMSFIHTVTPYHCSVWSVFYIK